MTLEENINKALEKKFEEMEESGKKKKKFKLPFGKKVSTGQKKKNFVTLMKINENGQVKFDKIQIKDQTIMEDKIPRLATSQCILYYKKNPIIILPSWSVEPFSPTTHFKNSLEDGTNTKGFAILLEKMQKEQLGTKKPLSGFIKWGLGLAVLALIGYALISGGI